MMDTKDSPIKILYVEDDAGLARLLQRRLERLGMDVRVAHTGAAALAICDEWRPALLAVDYDLPDINGMEVLRRLRDGNKPYPAVVFVTGAGDERVVVEAMRQGARDYLVKDSDGRYLDRLPNVIARALEHQFLQEQKQRAEAALRRSQKRLTEAQRIARLGSWEWDVVSDECRFQTLSPEYWGCPPLRRSAILNSSAAQYIRMTVNGLPIRLRQR